MPFSRVHLLHHAFQPLVHAAPVLQPAGEHALQLRPLVLRHGRKAARFRTLAGTAGFGLVVARGCRQVVTQGKGFVHILHVLFSQRVSFRLGQFVVLHGLAELPPPAFQFFAVHLTDLVAQHRPHEVLGYILRRILGTVLHVHQVVDEAAVHTVERNARQPFIQLVGQFLQLAGLVYVVIQFLGQSPAIASLTGILDLRPHIHVAAQCLHFLRAQAPQVPVPLAADLSAQFVYLCLVETAPVVVPAVVTSVVAGLRHSHLQVVRIRFLLHLVRVAVSRHTLRPLALLDGVGQILYRGLQQLVPVCKTVYSRLHFLGVPADAEQFVETSERHRVQQSPDTIHKGTAYLFEQVSAEDIVEYSGYRIENGVYQ